MSTNSKASIGDIHVVNNILLHENETVLNENNLNKNENKINDCLNVKNFKNKTKLFKFDKIKECIQQCLSDKSKKKIKNIINNVIELTDIEKVYLYLNLPTNFSQTLDNVKNKKQDNPFGRKTDIEISQTYIWIRSHLEEDNSVSLPKHEVYEEYRSYFESNMLEPLCVADFGKAMKHVFPNVKPRRLGQRGNSRYCYSGLCKKVNFPKPELPNLYNEKYEDKFLNVNNESKQDINGFEIRENNMNFFENKNSEKSSFINTNKLTNDNNDKNLILSVSSFIILEWARKFFSLKLFTIKDLAKHIICQNLIDKKSIETLTTSLSNNLDDKKKSNILKVIGKLFQIQLNTINSENNILNGNKLSSKKNILSLDPNKREVHLNKQTDEYFSIESNKKKIDLKEKYFKLSTVKSKKSKKNKNQSKLETKIKLESFDNFNFRRSFSNNELKEAKSIDLDKSLFKKEDELSKINQSLNNSFKLNSSNLKDNFNIQITNSSNQLVNDLSIENNLKRRHSTNGILSNNEKNLNKYDLDLKNNNFKFQLKRHSNDLTDISTKRLVKFNKMNRQVLKVDNESSIDEKKEDYLINLKNKKNNLTIDEHNNLVNLNKILKINIPEQSCFSYPSSTELCFNTAKDNLESISSENDLKSLFNTNLFTIPNFEQISLSNTNSLNNQDNISSKIIDENTFSYSNENQIDNCNLNLINNSTSNFISKNNLNYQLNINMDNINMEISSTISNTNKKTFNSSENQFSQTVTLNNNKINEELDLNNNYKSYCINEIEYTLKQPSVSCVSSKSLNSFTNLNEVQAITNNISCNNLEANCFTKLSSPNEQKFFQISLLNKNMNSLTNKNLNRTRHNSGPCYQYSSMVYNKNLPVSDDLKSTLLTPLFENNTIVNNEQKNLNFANNSFDIYDNLDKNNAHSIEYLCDKILINPNNTFSNMNNFSLPNSEQNYSFNNENKTALNEVNLNFQDSLLYAKSNRVRHVSSPYISCTLQQNDSLNQISTVSDPVINSINEDLHANSFCNENIFLLDNKNSSINQNLMINLNDQNVNNQIVRNQFNPNSPIMTVNNEKYKYSNSSSPINILNNDKSFKSMIDNENNSLLKVPELNTNKKDNELSLINDKKYWNEISILTTMEMPTQNNVSFHQLNDNYVNSNFNTKMDITIENFEDDYLQTTLHDLKDCDKDFSKFISQQFGDDLKSN